ncbi:MAG TPA: toprim domain-containing protein [bacterium]|nr:toprim domain-containing protein [bacterium]
MKPLLKDIYQRLNRAALLAELSPELSGDHYILTCPSCGKREAFLYLNSHIIICNRQNNCGYRASLWDWTAARYGYGQKETFAHLARLAGITPDGGAGSHRDPTTLLRNTQKACAKALRTLPDNPALRYLRETRHWNDDEIRASGIGYHPGLEALRTTLNADHATEEIDALPLMATKLFATKYRLIIPYHRDGVIAGFIGRLLEEHPDLPKYRFPKGTKVPLVDFEPAAEVTIVEGILDARLARVRGIKHIFAACTNQLSGSQLDTLTANRNTVKRVRLLFDNDPAGKKGTFTSIVKLLGDGFTDIRVGELPDGTKDLEEHLSATKSTSLGAVPFLPYYDWLKQYSPVS